MKWLVMVVTAILAAVPSLAQEPASFDFDMMDILKAGRFDMNLRTGRFNSITGGADIVLHGGEGDLQIKAGSIVFNWPETGDQPNSVTLETNVVVVHPQVTIHAAKGVWNVASGKLVITGNPILESPRVQRMRAEAMEMDMNTGDVTFTNPVAEGIDMGGKGGGGSSSSALLKDDDVKDWPALITALKAGVSASQPTPASQILQWVNPAVRNALPGIDPNAEQSAENKGFLLKEINKALRAPNLYKEPAWAGIDISADAAALLQRGLDTLTPAEIQYCNRRLIEAAFPGVIAIAPSPTE